MSLRVRWPIDIDDLLSICSLIDQEICRKVDIANSLGRGQEKIRSSLEWLNYMNLISSESRGKYKTTDFYKFVLKIINKNRSDAIALIYYNLYSNYDLFKWFIGYYGYEKVKQDVFIDVKHDISKIPSSVKEYLQSNNSDVKEDIISTQLRNDIKSLSFKSGFGSLGILYANNDLSQIKFNTYIPSKLVTYFIILSKWPEKTSAVSLDYFMYNKDSLGPAFMMQPDEVMYCLKRLESQGIVDVIDSGELFYLANKSNINLKEFIQKGITRNIEW